jgi:hypothetical protein
LPNKLPFITHPNSSYGNGTFTYSIVASGAFCPQRIAIPANGFYKPPLKIPATGKRSPLTTTQISNSLMVKGNFPASAKKMPGLYLRQGRQKILWWCPRWS